MYMTLLGRGFQVRAAALDLVLENHDDVTDFAWPATASEWPPSLSCQ